MNDKIENYKIAINKMNEMLKISKEIGCSGCNFDSLKQTIFKLENNIKLYEILEHNESINLGRFVKFDFKFGKFTIRNKNIYRLLYCHIFRSYSGIYEWFSEWFSKIVSPMLGESEYTYSLNSFDLKYIENCFERFGTEYDSYTKKYEDIKYCFSEKIDNQLMNCKNCYETLIELKNNEEFINKLDSFLENYFKLVLGENYSYEEDNE